MVIKRDPEAEAFIETLEDNHIYHDMRNKYDEVTNEGDNYTDEHDVIVAQYASEKHCISVEEAGQLYTRIEWEISEFHKRRLINN